MNEQLSPEEMAALHRKLAAQFFNGAWDLIDKQDRTPNEDLRMIHMAHASRMHWELVGTPRNRSVGEWQISRIYSLLGRGEAALFHARNSLAIATENELPPFQLGYACEAVARALVLMKDPLGAREYLARANDLVPKVTDDHDRGLLEADLKTISV